MIAILFGLLGFWINFQNIQLIEMPHFKVSILAGLYFPLLIAMAWGWRYGLISALAGGCQSMWWLWYSDGWGFVYAVPVFTVWIVWHGIWSDYRKRHKDQLNWYVSSFAVEIPFRIVAELGFYTVFRRLVMFNPPPWAPEITAAHVPFSWCHTIAVKHFVTAYILLLAVYVTLNLSPVRSLLGLSRRHSQQETTVIYAASFLVGLFLWMLDGVVNYLFHMSGGKSFWDWIVLDVSPYSTFMRFCYIVILLVVGSIVARLVAERKHVENELAKANADLKGKNEELEQVVYVASHDLRSPLVNIDGYGKELEFSVNELNTLLADNILADKLPQPVEASSKLKDELGYILNEDIPESLKFIHTSASKMDILLSGLLRLSRSGRAALKYEVLDMNHVVKKTTEAMEFQIKESGVTLTVDVLPPCFADAVQVDQIFANILGNALKYLDDSRPGSIQVSGKVDGMYSVYCIEDNGIGIEENHLKNIFEIFHQLGPDQNRGEGLGLTIVKRIVGRLNGAIEVTSKIGVGSRFYVSLPAKKLSI